MRAACCEATVLRHEVIAEDIRLLTVLWPDREHIPHAGQFFTLRSWGADEAPFLSRPISVHHYDADTNTIEFLYQVIGEGTKKLAQLKVKDTFQLTGPQGLGQSVGRRIQVGKAQILTHAFQRMCCTKRRLYVAVLQRSFQILIAVIFQK